MLGNDGQEVIPMDNDEFVPIKVENRKRKLSR